MQSVDVVVVVSECAPCGHRRFDFKFHDTTRLDVYTFGCSVTPPSGTVVDFVLGDVGSSMSARDQADLVLSLSCRGK
eukprot:s523_g15.t1